MPFEKVQAEKLAQSVVRQIELLILRGVLRPGERLPSERDLSERLGVSRPSLREAVDDLAVRGLLVTRAGSGIFVADGLNAVFPEPLANLFSAHTEAVFDYIDFRRDMEGLAAERAARHGSATDLKVIAAIMDKMEAAHLKRDPTDEAAYDADFHMAIIEAGHNIIMLHMMRSMYGLLKQGVFYNRQVMFKNRLTRDHLLDQHRAINAAIQARDPEGARLAISAHMSFVEQSLTEQVRAEHHEYVARQRYEHESMR